MTTRVLYRQSLRELGREVVTLGAAVRDNVGRATDALVDRDFGLVDDVIAADDHIDDLSDRLSDDAILLLAREAPVASELKYVTSVLRLTYELERSGDLMVNVARAAHRLPGPIRNHVVFPPLLALAEGARAIFDKALGIYGAAIVADLNEEDDKIDDAHTRLLNSLARPEVDRHTIIALTITGRCYERLADHAVNLAARSYLAAGLSE